MQKCNELFNEKAKTEYSRVEKVMNTKEMMKVSQNFFQSWYFKN